MTNTSRPINQPGAPGSNTGHGHVFPRPDGARARCGGPALCSHCRADAEREQLGGPREPRVWLPTDTVPGDVLVLTHAGPVLRGRDLPIQRVHPVVEVLVPDFAAAVAAERARRAGGAR